jgi:hypothetical protein
MPQKTATKKAPPKITPKKAVKKKKKKMPIDATYKQLMQTAKEISIPIDLLEKHIYNFGRPTDYRPEMCTQLIHIMASGRTFQDACTMLGITVVTAYWWTKEPTEDEPNAMFKPDFFKAKKLGQALSELWWNELGKKNLNNLKFNNTLYMMFRSNLHGWTRKLEGKLEQTITENHIETKRVEMKVDIQMSAEEVKEYIEGLVAYGIIEPERIADAVLIEVDKQQPAKAH